MAHRKRETKYYNFLIVPDGRHDPISFKLRRFFILAVFGLAITVFALIIAGALSYWKVAEVALDYSRLEEENFKLVKSLQQIEKLEEDLGRVQQYEKKLRGSLDGYISINESANTDSTSTEKLDFDEMSIQEKRTIFNSIPSILPVEGFIARGFEANAILSNPHLGLDIVAPTGTPIKAVADGVILFSGWTTDGGNILIIEHDYGFVSVYKHNERNLVSQLEKVEKGQVIALLGNTGKITSGPHLHLEIWQNGLPVDPAPYIGTGTNKS